ncbi:hypothetical protein EJ110_NYTH30703 [Nymphaea thermarum]|nr:hypothetical protein EJ110_NYTH30703 [Nymphaea thermarum]
MRSKGGYRAGPGRPGQVFPGPGRPVGPEARARARPIILLGRAGSGTGPRHRKFGPARPVWQTGPVPSSQVQDATRMKKFFDCRKIKRKIKKSIDCLLEKQKPSRKYARGATNLCGDRYEYEDMRGKATERARDISGEPSFERRKEWGRRDDRERGGVDKEDDGMGFRKRRIRVEVGDAVLLDDILQKPINLMMGRRYSHVGKDGDVIDCVDIYAQPAFDNPLLKDHKIQVRPSFVPLGLELANSSGTHVSLSNWRKSGSCPAGTVPILRSVSDLRPGHALSHASLKITKDDPIDYSAEKIQEVNPALFGDYQTRIFLQWHVSLSLFLSLICGASLFLNHANITRSVNRQSSSTAPCYNLNCGGFVQTGEDITIGQTVATSMKGDKKHQYTLKFAIFKDMKTGNWILTVDGKQVGYWPGKLFSHLNNWANTTIYGGSVTDTFPGGLHTETQMGSGEPPSKKDDNYGTVSFAGDIRYMNGDGEFKRLPKHEALITNSNCYDLIYQTHMFKDHIYFGGHGHGPDCE